MQRALTVLVILSLLGGQVGMLGALLGRHHAQQQMQRRIDTASESSGNTSDIQHLIISRSERQSSTSSFVWVEEHEFRYQGNLYDIVHQEWKGSDWHVWVYHDRQEEHYLEVLARATNSPIFKESGAPVHPRPLVVLPRALTPAASVSPPSPLLRSRSFPRVSIADYQAPYLEVPHPPPWA